MFITTPCGRVGPIQPWVDVPADSLAWNDKGRKDWTSHTVKMTFADGNTFFIVDRVEDRGGGIWRLHLIDQAKEEG